MARWILVLVLAAPALPAQEEARMSFPPVTRAEVWQAIAGELREHGLREEQMPVIEEMDLPVRVPAAPGRALRVAAVCWNRERIEFRLECREPGHCIPFLTYVRTSGERTREFRTFGRALAGPCRAGSRSASAPPRKIAVRAGDRAVVVFLGNRLRLTTSVICLERGAEGEIIRVKNQDGRIFRARVAAPAVLEAFPQ